MDKYNIEYFCNTKSGASGSPILNINNNEIIGVHKEANSKFGVNRGTLLKDPINDFIETKLKNAKNEIETKLRQIKVSQEFEGEELFERITLLIIYHINKTIKESYQAVYDTWIELINNVFYIEAPKDLYGYSGNAKSDYEGIEKEIEEAKKFLYNSIGQNKENFKRTKRDQFGIEDIINNYEYDISSNLGKIINEFRIFFNNHLCIANEKICENGEPKNILSPIQQYQFQVAKVRDSVSDLKSLISYSRNMIGEDTLKALNSDEFLELYKEISKNKNNEFLNKINVY
jgi:hypothetical protein